MSTPDDVVDLLLQRLDELHGRSLRNIDEERQRVALRTTAAFVDENLPHALAFGTGSHYEAKFELLEFALDQAPADGLVLEFGVAAGDTLRRITAKRSPAHGFDSFEGLPEAWRTGFPKGAFTAAPPDIPGATLHAGWFEDSLPRFFAENSGSVAFAHIDADLYSSTVTILREAEDRLVEGSVLLFDEYFNYPGWHHHEHKAFTEFIERTGHEFEYVAYTSIFEQVLVRLTS
jgi:hypothetical protein